MCKCVAVYMLFILITCKISEAIDLRERGYVTDYEPDLLLIDNNTPKS